MRHRLADLVERLLQVARDGEHVTDVDDVELLAQIDAGFVVVRAEQVGGAPDSLRAESRAGPVGGTRIQRHAEDRDLGVIDLVHVLDERTFQECPAFACEVRLLAADERRDGAVVDRRRGLQAKAQAAVDLLAQPAVAEVGLGLLGPGALGIGQCWIGPVGVVGHECVLLTRRLVADRVRRTSSGESVGLLIPYLGSDLRTRHSEIATSR